MKNMRNRRNAFKNKNVEVSKELINKKDIDIKIVKKVIDLTKAK